MSPNTLPQDLEQKLIEINKKIIESKNQGAHKDETKRHDIVDVLEKLFLAVPLEYLEFVHDQTDYLPFQYFDFYNMWFIPENAPLPEGYHFVDWVLNGTKDIKVTQRSLTQKIGSVLEQIRKYDVMGLLEERVGSVAEGLSVAEELREGHGEEAAEKYLSIVKSRFDQSFRERDLSIVEYLHEAKGKRHTQIQKRKQLNVIGRMFRGYIKQTFEFVNQLPELFDKKNPEDKINPDFYSILFQELVPIEQTYQDFNDFIVEANKKLQSLSVDKRYNLKELVSLLREVGGQEFYRPYFLNNIVRLIKEDKCKDEAEIVEVAVIHKEGWSPLRRLGIGVYGKVYLVRNELANEEQALKLLYLSERGKINLAGMGLTEKRLAGKEGGALLKANSLNNPHIIIGHDVGYDDEMKKFFILMELVNDTLYTFVEKYWAKEGKHPPFELIIDSMLQLSDGVGALHQPSEIFPNGYVHGDISPKNIGVKNRKDGAIYKAMDFGLSSSIKGIDPRYDPLNVASICTRARELFYGNQPDARSDVYAIGATYYWVIFNRYPHEPDMKKPEMPGSARDRYEKAVKKHHDKISLDKLFKDSGIPKPLEDVLKKCLEKNPTQRYQNAYELKKALEDINKSLS